MARQRFGKKIDNVRWNRSLGSALALSAGAVGVAFISVTSLPETILRIRGEVLVWLDGTQAPGSLVAVSMGIIKVPEGTGTTVVYNPQSDSNAPWLWYTNLHVGYEEYVTDVIDAPNVSSARVTIDNKAMRKTKPDEEYQFVIDNTTVGNAASINVAFATRFLIGF